VNIEVTVTVKVTHPRGTTTTHGIAEQWEFGDNPRFALAAIREAIGSTADELERAVPSMTGNNDPLSEISGHPRRRGSLGMAGGQLPNLDT